MQASTITTTTVRLTDTTTNANVNASVTYDAATRTARLTPQAALQFGRAYLFTVKGGAAGVKDLAGTPLASDATSTFTTEASPQPMLVLTSTSNRFGLYLAEILRNEGLNAFTTLDVSLHVVARPQQLPVVVLGETSLSTGQVTTLTNWVNAGGNLIAMRPDKKLASLLGLAAISGTSARTRTCGSTRRRHPAPESPSASMQFHGTSDRYLPLGATTIATLYSSSVDRHAEPRGDAPVGRLERRPGRRVHVRPRALGRLHAAGEPGVGRPGAGRRARSPTQRHVLLDLAQHEQDLRSRRQTSSSGCSRT